MSSPRRVLVRLPNPLGDVVMATPALRALRRALPDSEITLLGLPHHEGLLRGVRSYDRFLAYRGRGAWSLLARAREVRARRFDWALILPDSPRAALDPFLAGIPRRAGYGRDPLRRVLVTDRIEVPRENGRRVPFSMIERYLRITRRLGVPDAGPELDLEVHDEAVARVRERMVAAGVGAEERVLLVAPGAAYGASKLWPPAYFARASDEIARRHALRPLIVPAPNATEIETARDVSQRMKERHVALLDPDPSLEILKALVARATLVFTNDTGPRHVAVALRRPVVVVMGPTDPRHTAHLLERQRVLREDVACSPCGEKICPIGDHRCMVQLLPERAIRAADELLTPPSDRPAAR